MMTANKVTLHKYGPLTLKTIIVYLCDLCMHYVKYLAYKLLESAYKRSRCRDNNYSDFVAEKCYKMFCYNRLENDIVTTPLVGAIIFHLFHNYIEKLKNPVGKIAKKTV